MITTNVDARMFNEMQNYHLTAEGKLVFLTIMLAPERSLIGIHKVDVDMLKVRTGITKKKITQALQHLNDEGLIIGDLEQGEFYTPYLLKSNPLKGGKTYKIYMEDLQRVRNRNLVELMVIDFNATIPVTFAAALEDAGYGELLGMLDKQYSDEELDNARKAYVKAREDR